MRITALGKPFYNYSRNYTSANKALMSAPKSSGADIFCFKGEKPLADKISIIPSSKPTNVERGIESRLGVKPVETDIKKFKNGETYVNIKGSIMGKDVYIMPSDADNPNDGIMETLLKADAAQRGGAGRVIAVIPNFPYARQEKRTESGEPIAARLSMDLLKAAGVNGIITTDLHTPSLEGFASNDMKVTHLESMDLMKTYIQNAGISDLVVVSPDLGGTKRADKLARALGCDKAIVYKHRQAHNEATAEDLIGDVKGKNCIIFDDIIDTAGTIAEASKLLKKNGAKDIYVCAAHGLFNGDAMKKLADAPVKKVVVTNSVPAKSSSIDKIEQVDISVQIAEAMRRISA